MPTREWDGLWRTQLPHNKTGKEVERLRDNWKERDERYSKRTRYGQLAPFTEDQINVIRLARRQEAAWLPESVRGDLIAEAMTWRPPYPKKDEPAS